MSGRWSLGGLGVRRGLLAAGVVVAAAGFGPVSAWADAPAAPNGGKELTALRTATSRTYATPDGARVTQVGAAPINVRNSSGDWVPIDTDLKPTGDVLQSTAAPVTVQLPQTLGAEPIRLQHDADVASVAPQDASPTPADVVGARASYPDALGGADSRYEVQPTGVKETITVDSADAPSHYAYTLNYSSGLSAHQLADGAIELRHADGSVAFTIPAPTVQEHDGALTSSHVQQTLSADGHTLAVDVDSDWLSHAALPVKIDPDFWFTPDTNCDIANGASANTVNCQSSFSVGTDGSPAVSHRALLHFSLPTGDGAIPRDAIILSARLGLTQTALSGPGPVDIDAYPLSRTFTGQATWNSYNSTNAWTAPGGDYDTTNKLDSYHSDASWTGEGLAWRFGKLAQGWVDGSIPDNGFLLRAADESSPSKATFAGLDTTTSTPPLINITWSQRTGNSPGAKIISQPLSDHLSVGVNVATGNLLTQGSEIDLPGVGQDLALGSSYNQMQDGSFMGYGSLSYESTLGFLDSRMYREGYNGHETLAWRAPDGTWFRFDRDPAHDQPGAAAWTMADGLRAHVTTDRADNDGFPTTATITFDQSNTKWHYTFGEDTNESSAFYGNLQSIVDRNNNAITLNYPTAGAKYATSVTDTTGRTLTLNYVDSQGYGGEKQLTSVVDSAGRQWKWSYTTGDLLSTYTDPDNNVTHYYWDNGAKLVKIVTGAGRTTILGYDPATSRMTSVRRVVNGSTTAPTGGTDASSNWGSQDAVWQFNYAPVGGNTCPTPASPNPPVIGRTLVTDPDGHATTYCYDTQDRITQTFDALNRANSTTYDSFSNVTKASSLAGTANAATSTFKFSSDGNENPMMSATPVTSAANIDNPDPATSQVSSATYGSSAHQYSPTTSTDPQGTSTYYGYDAAGNLNSVGDSQTNPGNQATLAYNSRGQVTSSTDGKQQQTTYAYATSAPWNLNSVTPPTAVPLSISPTSFTYDSLSRVKTITTGPAGHTTTKTLVYDGEDRIKSVTLSGASTGSFAFVYDADGNLTQRTDSANNITTYTVNALGQRTNEAFPGSKNNAYTYDKLGNLASLTDATGQTTSYSYDAVNRVKTISSPQRTGASTTDTITYTYNERSGSTSPDNVVISYPGGTTKTTKYDLAGDPTSIVATNASNATLINLGLTWITGSGSTQRQSDKVITRTLDGQTTTYGYSSNVGRLLAAQTPGATSYAYSYDNAGNRLTKTTTPSSGTADVVSFTYNADNELCRSTHATAVADCTSTPTGSTSYGYDAEGNRTTAGSSTLSFDGFDRLTTGGLSYLSPGNGELVASTGTTYQNSQLGLIRQTTGSTIEALVRDPNGQVVAQRSASDKQFYLTDQLGSTLALVSDAGAQTRSLRYDPDGTATTNTGTGPAAVITWAGGQNINGQYHFGARYYDPNTAAWTQQDPLNQIADLQQANRYAYAGGDPIDQSDPLGTCSDSVRGVAGTPAEGTTGTCAAYNGEGRSDATPSGPSVNIHGSDLNNVVTGAAGVAGTVACGLTGAGAAVAGGCGILAGDLANDLYSPDDAR